MSNKANNLQDIFLNQLRRSKSPVTMFLVKGVKLQGIITWFDNFSVLLRRDGQSQLVYKHAISTIMPGPGFDPAPIRQAFAEMESKSKLRAGQPVSMSLLAGVMLQGEIGAYDLFCVMLERDRAAQLVYKHAISTVQPNGPVNLNVQDEDGQAIEG